MGGSFILTHGSLDAFLHVHHCKLCWCEAVENRFQLLYCQIYEEEVSETFASADSEQRAHFLNQTMLHDSWPLPWTWRRLVNGPLWWMQIVASYEPFFQGLILKVRIVLVHVPNENSPNLWRWEILRSKWFIFRDRSKKVDRRTLSIRWDPSSIHRWCQCSETPAAFEHGLGKVAKIVTSCQLTIFEKFHRHLNWVIWRNDRYRTTIPVPCQGSTNWEAKTSCFRKAEDIDLQGGTAKTSGNCLACTWKTQIWIKMRIFETRVGPGPSYCYYLSFITTKEENIYTWIYQKQYFPYCNNCCIYSFNVYWLDISSFKYTSMHAVMHSFIQFFSFLPLLIDSATQRLIGLLLNWLIHWRIDSWMNA